MDDARSPSEDPSPFNLAHRQAAQTPLSEVTLFLSEVLSRRLTAYICGLTSTKLISQMSTGEVTEVSDEIEERLRAAFEVCLVLLQFDAPATVRAWFIGMNPELDDDSPAEAIRSGMFQDAMGAASVFIAHG